MNVGQKIMTLREKAGLSKGRLATLADVSATYIGQLESGSKQPTVDTLSRICAALDVTLAEFFTEENRQGLSLELSRLLSSARDMTPEQVDALIAFIRVMKEG